MFQIGSKLASPTPPSCDLQGSERFPLWWAKEWEEDFARSLYQPHIITLVKTTSYASK
jgi:hypothetical protein